MELRIWVPGSLAGWRYCLKHPRSFLIGAYGFKRWFETHQQLLSARSTITKHETKIEQLTTRLSTVGKELSVLRRGASK